MSLTLAERNPELRRQLWLEFSPARLVGMPGVLGLVFAAFALASVAALPGVAQTAFAVLVWAYGARLASAALLDEVNEATWDAQRLSSLTPWQLTWGKLLGGTAYAWYGGAISLAVWWGASLVLGRGLPLMSTVGAVAGGLGLQAVSLIMALSAARRGVAGARRGGAWWVVMLFSLPWLGSLPFQGSERTLLWWGLPVSAAGFFTTMSVVFAAWAVLGAQRMMAAALQVPLRPVVWLAFLLWLSVFAAGFEAPGGALWRAAVALTVLASTAAYVTLFVEPPRLDLWQRLAARWRESGFSLATQQRVPLMAASLSLTLVGGALASLLAYLPEPWGATATAERLFGSAGLPLTLALLTLRDLALACAVHWSPGIRRAEGATLVLLALINFVLPWLLLSAGAVTLAGWLQPLIGQFAGSGSTPTSAWLAVSIAALQAGIAFAIAVSRWRGPEVPRASSKE